MTKKHDIIWLNTIDSTNDEARRRMDTLDNLSVLSAREQTKGRGQRGNTWSADPGENLTFSIVMRFGGHGGLIPVRALDQFVISEIAALTVVDLLASHDIEAKIKWPNDIYVGSKKICGILIENSVRDALLSTSIIGIGLNINQTVFDPSLPNPTSMALCTETNGSNLSPEAVLEEFMDIFKSYCSRYLNITGGFTRLRRLYLSQLWCLNEPAEFIDLTTACTSSSTETDDNVGKQPTGRIFNGTIKGLSPIGHLRILDTEKGELKEFAFKEIGYII